MTHFYSAPTRVLPSNPNLDQLRKQAKDLLKAFAAGDSAAASEVALFERSPNRDAFALVDAQRVLARAYGFSSWNKLKQHVDGINVKAFCEAVDAGDIATVRRLAKARPDLVDLSPDGAEGERIALHIAIFKGDIETTRALMELGSDARRGIWPHRSATTGHTIARDRGYDEIVAIIEREEERRRQARSASGATVGSTTDQIHKAILQDRNNEALRLLESDLSLVGACSLRGTTPLHVAAWAHNTEMIAWLLDHGAAVNAMAPFDTPLGAAAEYSANYTPLDYAAIVAGWSTRGPCAGYMENSDKGPAAFDATVKLLRERGAILTLRAAVAVGDAKAVRKMHRDGQLTNEVHHLRGGLLAIAARVNRPEMVSLLLDLGFDPDETVLSDEGHRMSWGMPLWFASMCGRHEIAELLLSRGADVDAIVYASGDSLCMAADERMEALLRNHGARLAVEHVTDLKTGQAILDGRLKAYSLNVDDPTLTDLAEQMLWGAGGDEAWVRLCLPYVTRKRDDPWWNYVLLHAKIPQGFKIILDHGVDPDVSGDGGYTILHHLASDYSDDENRIARATILLDSGASLKRRDPMLKSTPLGWACRWGHVELVQLYLARGADPIEPDAEPWATPLAWAKKGGHDEIVNLLASRADSI
jgi:ankyrin repeat protein